MNCRTKFVVQKLMLRDLIIKKMPGIDMEIPKKIVVVVFHLGKDLMMEKNKDHIGLQGRD